MRNFISKEIDNETYTLVDEYDDIFDNKKIYYFYSALTNQNKFFYKDENEFIQIVNQEEIDLIEDVKNLKETDFLFSRATFVSLLTGMKGIRKFSQEERKDFFNEQFETLKSLDIKGVDYEKIKGAIFSRGNVYGVSELPGKAGLFHMISQDIYLSNDCQKGTRLHETIHKITNSTLKGKILEILSRRFC